MKKQILLIDDDKNERKHLAYALNSIKSRCRFSYASTAEQALSVLPFLKPDFVFIDYHLHKKNGLQLLFIIKNELKLNKTKVFLYFENRDEKTMKIARMLGAAGCVCQPRAIERLARITKAVLSGDPITDYVFVKSV